MSLGDQQQDPEYQMEKAQEGKRQRHDFTLEEVSVLNEEWERGMTSSGKGCEEKIKNCAERLHTTVERIRMWIGNKRGKEKRKGESSVTKKKKSYRYTSGPNAFSLFLSKMKRGTEDKAAFFTKAAAKWRLMPENEKQPIQEEAAKLRQDPMKGMSREKSIHTELAIMSKCCDRLSSFGFHFGGIGVDTAEKCPPVVVGSHLGVQFMNKPELQAQYTRHFNLDHIAPKTIQTPQEKREEMRQKVRRKFRDCWEEATGSKKAVPYGKIKAGEISVELSGMQSGVPFKDPSTYPFGVLEEILRCPVKLTVQNFDPSERKRTVTDTSTQQLVEEDQPPELSSEKAAIVQGVLDIIDTKESMEDAQNETTLEPENRVTEVMVEALQRQKNIATNVMTATGKQLRKRSAAKRQGKPQEGSSEVKSKRQRRVQNQLEQLEKKHRIEKK